MIYSATIETLKNTAISTPKKTQLVVTTGLVYKVEVVFPAGSAGLMGVAILDGSLRVWPSTAGEWFVGDGNIISFDDVYLKEDAPYIFDIHTYNLDDTYAHKVYIRIGFVTKEIFMARFLPHLSYKYFEEMLKTLQVSQQALAKQQQEAILATPFTGL
jgi:hypothetical protein